MNKCGIYAITNKKNGNMYIGQSVNMIKRWNVHLHAVDNCSVHKAIQKYGKDNFTFKILEECIVDELNNREEFYIQKFNSYCSGYNETPGGNQHSQYTNNKLQDIEIEQIKELLFSSNLSQSEIGLQFKVDQGTVSHINQGDAWFDNKQDYPIRKHKIAKEHMIMYCSNCGKELTKQAFSRSKTGLCSECYKITQVRKDKPEPIMLAKLVSTQGFEAVGRLYGVSGNAIKKWCKSYNIPHLKKELVEWYNINKL